MKVVINRVHLTEFSNKPKVAKGFLRGCVNLQYVLRLAPKGKSMKACTNTGTQHHLLSMSQDRADGQSLKFGKCLRLDFGFTTF